MSSPVSADKPPAAPTPIASGMASSVWGWAVLGGTLYFTTFGLTGGICVILYVLAFVAGCLTIAYYIGRKQSIVMLEYGQPSFGYPRRGIPKLVKEVTTIKPVPKVDKRLTGSNVIDEALQEVLEYTFRDYIHVWYQRLSDHEGFKYDMRQTIQKVVIAFSSRTKEIDWVPYLTTRLVDDFTSHVRMFRKAKEKMKAKDKDGKYTEEELMEAFFDQEAKHEVKKDCNSLHICRDMICLKKESEIQFLQDLSEVLLFLLLPPEDYHNKPFRYICREVMVNGVFIPSIDLLSDPDYINQYIAWMCKEDTLTKEAFLTVLKTSDTIEELQAVREKVDLDIAKYRAKDTGGSEDTEIKRQLSSLQYVKVTCDKQIARLRGDLDEVDAGDALGANSEYLQYLAPGKALYSLSFEEMLSNNLALAAFIDYMTSIGAQVYIYFYLNIDAYRVSAEQQISAARESTQEDEESTEAIYEMLQSAALSLYNQYLSEKATQRITLDEALLRRTLHKIKQRPPHADCFEEVRCKVCEILEGDNYYKAFKKSTIYVKLLAELDLLNKDVEVPEADEPPEATILNDEFHLEATVISSGVMKEEKGNKSYAVYFIRVMKRERTDGEPEIWDCYRRYSDFHDLHMTITDKYPSLATLNFPSKKLIDNLKEEFLEKRKKELDHYLQTLLNRDVLANNRGLLQLIYGFMQPGLWEKGKSEMARKMDSIVNPLKMMGNAVKSVPDNFVDGMIKMSGGIRGLPKDLVDGFGKILKGVGPATEKRDSLEDLDGLDTLDGEADNIPLRIMLLLMDEVFDLKSKNQWLRRRIVAVLRQIIKMAMGDSINRKILDHVELMTSAEQVAEYVQQFRDSFWPGGILAEPRPERDLNTMMRTRVITKTKMLGGVADEVRHLVGSETTRKGVFRVFEMFQYKALNRRLLYVIMEGMMETLFPDNKFRDIFLKIHSKSPRAASRLEEKRLVMEEEERVRSEKERARSESAEKTNKKKKGK
ncbi:sorting nexin-13 [Lingula anatina]|uniref:Sorting nexin-13 n=1 Tax=Lingula anatina TaxID=7574 RepID=A0A2R2MTU3_LINAN|nr:sorting nexin-13 [Lingula anatina]|eukprot:XP_023933666.1 sorting nexin-13 [Lingula anatina]